MDLKIKIALQMMATKVERGILNEEEAKAEFKKITGLDPESPADPENTEQQELGEFLDALGETMTGRGLLDPEPEKEPEAHQTVDLDLNPPTDKMIDKRLSGKDAQAKK